MIRFLHIGARLMIATTSLIFSGCGPTLEQRVQQGLAMTERKDYSTAIKYFDQLIADDPSSVEAWNGRGLAKKASGDSGGALEDYEHAIQLDSNEAHLYNNRGTLLMSEQDLLGALRDFDRALSLDPKYDLAYFNRAQLRITTGDYTGALEDLDALKNLVGEERYPNFLFHRGYAQGSLHHFELAEADLSRYLANAGDAAWVGKSYGQRGMNRLNLHSYDSALADLKRAEDLGQRDKEVLYYQGFALSALGRWEEAHAVTLKTLELDPSFPEAKWGLARCLEELGRMDEACQAYHEALDLGHRDTEGAIKRVCSRR